MVSTAQVLKSIQLKDYKPVYLLLGKEKFFHDQIINDLSSTLFPDISSRSLNRIILQGSENTLSEVVAASLSFPMLSEFKLVLVKDFNKIKFSDSDSFMRYLEKPQKTTVLLLTCEEMGKTKIFSKIRNSTEVIDCKPIPDYKIVSWMKERIAQKKLQISQNALMMFAEYTGNNLLTIEHELNKIINYKSDSSIISEEDIIAITGMSKEYNVFTFQKALIEKDYMRSYSIGKNLIDAGENLNLIITIIFSFFKKALIVAKNQGSTDILKISDYQKRDISLALKKFSFRGLENAVQILHSVDRLIKSTAISDLAVMQNMCYIICRKRV